ncbi:MAG: hydroxyethylthiazole kinase [Ahrensia sp.]|nr:hydroxyethylthiazole kinase [Ahrensia sp.]
MVVHHSAIDGKRLADCVDAFRRRRPHVHCITNAVAQHFTANVLLAAGATPSMTINRSEISDFVLTADALLINLGTMDDERSKASAIAVQVASAIGKPWAMDPVFAHASTSRLQIAKHLLRKGPDLVRCNATEAAALFAESSFENNGQEHPEDLKGCLAITGEVDHLSTPETNVAVHNGSPLMDRVTAMGCALTALAVGFLPLDEEPIVCVAAAHCLFGLAGETAVVRSSGPGSFASNFLDALHTLSGEDIGAGAQLS